MRTTSLQKAAVALLSVLFFLPPLIFWSGSFSIIDIKVFFVKILIAGIAAGLAVDWFINKRIHVTGLKSVIIGRVYGKSGRNASDQYFDKKDFDIDNGERP